MSTTRKATSPVKATRAKAPAPAKPATAPTKIPQATVLSERAPDASAPELKKQELLAKVVEASGVKKKMVKPVVEAMLAVMGEALAEGRGLNLSPFGKLKHNRTKETAEVRIMITKIRQSKSTGGGATAKDTVADATE